MLYFLFSFLLQNEGLTMNWQRAALGRTVERAPFLFIRNLNSFRIKKFKKTHQTESVRIWRQENNVIKKNKNSIIWNNPSVQLQLWKRKWGLLKQFPVSVFSSVWSQLWLKINSSHGSGSIQSFSVWTLWQLSLSHPFNIYSICEVALTLRALSHTCLLWVRTSVEKTKTVSCVQGTTRVAVYDISMWKYCGKFKACSPEIISEKSKNVLFFC